MSQILGVKFNDYGQVFYYGSGPFVVREGQHVIVKTDQGMGLGKVILTRQAPRENETPDGEALKAIYRLANDKDLEAAAENELLSREAYQYCRKSVSRLKLGMKLVDVEVFFDRSKMVYYFTAPGRIDFRELIKDLVREYRTRIELRQIGVRHETQMLGAIGNCGQMCCCRRFMRKFVPVTIKMAKEQNLFLNPTKISGICGRLLCCLSFEQKGYEEFHRMCPRVGKKFTTAIGAVKVLRSNFFKKSVTLLTENYDEREVSIDEWNEIVNKPPSEEAMAEARALVARGRRSGRKPVRSEADQDGGRDGAGPDGTPGSAPGGEFDAASGLEDDAGADDTGDLSPEILALEDRDPDQGGGRPPRAPRQARQPRPAGAAGAVGAVGDDTDGGAKVRRPRRRKRKPPKK
ncbi:PSP1 domain-containing protein [Pseudodesulfovibrio pelocollis]|uniref:PSP1 domain-containing protein n=1 Tax=Pseudodesulfovibrio pelocollis TaxID=3051432 RepID=UPI00255A9B42|nr:regulatory iron-sulfur-containing complex subunit RicT [Pseudodesulfovibrio sp. SB368]